MTIAMACPSFEPSVVWEDRQWFWWERTLYGYTWHLDHAVSSMTKLPVHRLITGERVSRAQRIGTCFVIGSLLLTVGLFIVLPLLPIILWLTSRDPLPPTGPLKVGVMDIQHSFLLTPEPEPMELPEPSDPSPSKNANKTTDKTNQLKNVAYRMRIFYPASPSAPSTTTRTPWLPRDKEYGRAHLTFMVQCTALTHPYLNVCNSRTPNNMPGPLPSPLPSPGPNMTLDRGLISTLTIGAPMGFGLVLRLVSASCKHAEAQPTPSHTNA